MLADIDICNMALAYVLTSETLTSLDDQTPAGMACNRFYPICRDHLLQHFPWSFATVETALTLLDTNVVTNWAYTYALPTDCLDVQRLVYEGVPYPTGHEDIAFSLGNYNGQHVLHTNLPYAVLRYTARVEDTTLYPPDVCDALAALVASRICALLGKIDSQASLMQLAENLMAMAFTRNANQGSTGGEPDGPLVLSRL